jgi:hypothetical protein
MVTPQLPLVDSERARQIWAEYQQQHDVSGVRGQAAGIEPVSGRVWFGASASEIRQQMAGEGIDRPIYCVRVGQDYYLRKGGHRPERYSVRCPPGILANSATRACEPL